MKIILYSCFNRYEMFNIFFFLLDFSNSLVNKYKGRKGCFDFFIVDNYYKK